ncbi:methyltransferase, TIGR04325 family [Lacrimispora saccharolytica]|uniref:methyltransferase, TIGR04325 family n=1 Tax=Lacrimispora saccharolytica TaxID=84030 RepID=UPI00265CF6F5|nr:methyltransferase, TIGR04325 family [Lacrimispora saccharolytica]MCF2657072.1 methyltransferase, TIGR04325 family [Lacrimispora saccharolytica]
MIVDRYIKYRDTKWALSNLQNILYYEGDFENWEEASSVAAQYGEAYEQESILEQVGEATAKVRNGDAAYEQDGVLFDKLSVDYQLISAFLYIYSQTQRLKVIDYGGALGSIFFRYRKLWDKIETDWSIIEQPHFVEYGRKKVPEIKFYYGIEEYDGVADVLLLASILMYIDDVYVFFSSLLKKRIRYIIVDRTAFSPDDQDIITLQYVPEQIYKAVYPAHLISNTRFKKLVTDSGYTIISEWDHTQGGITLKKDRKFVDTLEKGYLLEYVEKIDSLVAE